MSKVMTRMPIADRRAQLIDAALQVAMREGIRATTARRVAGQAGVALGVVHYCFTDTDELFSALAARIVDDLASASAAALPLDNEPELSTALRYVISALWDTVEVSAGEQLLTYEITTHALRTAGVRSVAERQYEASQAATERLLELTAAASGATWLRPVPELASEALAYLDGVTLRWLVDSDSAGARARLDTFAAFLATSATQRPQRSEPAS